jgi:dipeptidyl aminopeptidase/acylaminoacyl peptidase
VVDDRARCSPAVGLTHPSGRRIRPQPVPLVGSSTGLTGPLVTNMEVPVPTEAPHGSWPSPITAEVVLSAAVSLAQVAAGEDDLWWDELRPAEAGRVQVVRHRPGGGAVDVLPEGFSARSRVHEYGGGAWWLHQDTLFVVNAADQRLWRIEPGGEPVPLTPEPARPMGDRHADGCLTADARWVICVRERHGEPGTEPGQQPAPAGEPANELVAVRAHPGRDADGRPLEPSEPVVVVSGPDFVSFPRVSPDGRRLCWTQWDHPRMPWDGTELWVADLFDGDDGLAMRDARSVAGGTDESIFQPSWSRAGDLLFVSDASGWWNLRRIRDTDLGGGARPASEAIAPIDGDVGTPQWVFAMSRYAELADGRILLAITRHGLDHLAVAAGDGSSPRPVDSPYTALSALTRYGQGAAGIAAGPDREPAVIAVDLPAEAPADPSTADPSTADPSTADPSTADPSTAGPSAEVVEVRPPRDLGIEPSWWSRPEPISFASGGGHTAHALFYPPTSPESVAPAGERPPLLVMSHGGPTGMARPQLQLNVQYWTSRGFAVVDVNYAGSTGFGRAYRRLLDGEWGILDVQDCIAAGEHLVATGRADGDRLAIRGGSAGGFTTLCALTFHDTFAVGASLYGVADLELLATETHKFEARYLDSLVGPYPEQRQTYLDRSPIHHTELLSCPVVVFQGLEDAVVPPSQAEAIVGALRAKGVPVAYLAFEGEQHGFRQAANIRRVLQAERYVVSTILGIELADDEVIEPVAIENLAVDTG